MNDPILSVLTTFNPAVVMMYIFSLSITPGPNNVMLAASGASYGYLKTLPHMLGITCGAVLLVVLSAAGLGVVFLQYPWTRMVLFVVGVAYLCFLASKIARAG